MIPTIHSHTFHFFAVLTLNEDIILPTRKSAIIFCFWKSLSLFRLSNFFHFPHSSPLTAANAAAAADVYSFHILYVVKRNGNVFKHAEKRREVRKRILRKLSEIFTHHSPVWKHEHERKLWIQRKKKVRIMRRSRRNETENESLISRRG